MGFKPCFVCLILALSTSGFAAPATQPGKPKSEAPAAAGNTVEKDTTLYTCASLGFQFRAPTSWNARQNDPATGRFELDMAPLPAKRKVKSGTKVEDPAMAMFEVFGGKPCHGEPKLDDQVKAICDSQTNDGKSKLLKDEPGTLGGEPARVLIFESSFESVIQKNGKETRTPIKARDHFVVALRDGKIYEIWLRSDFKNYERHLRLFNKTLSTFQWLAKQG